MKYPFIDRYSSAYGVERMCRVLEVSRSGFYDWRNRPRGKREEENEKLLMAIRESYYKSKRNYGSPRIMEDLREKGIRCGKNRVAKIMKVNGMVANSKRKFKATTNSKHNLPVTGNLLIQKFVSTEPNKVWCSDITYIQTLEGWLYLVIIMDLFSRQVVGWAMSERLTADFVIRALRQAWGRRNPALGCIFHSDRGVQYACSAFQKLLKDYGFLQSMSRKGDCYDNAVVESFFHTLKTEHVHHCIYTTRAEARQSIFEYIEIFYNRQRRHSALGYRSPISFELESRAA